MDLNKRNVGFGIAFVLALYAASTPASVIWGTDASGELTGSRTSNPGGGISATQQWANGGFTLSWEISWADGRWTYDYTATGQVKELSHFILEVTNDDQPFVIYDGSDTPREGPQDWTLGPSNPLMPNDIYGVKFDYGSLISEYTIITNRAPVYGVFYTKDGKDGGNDVVAWSNALNNADYKTNETLSRIDYIVRPNGAFSPAPINPAPIPAPLALLGLGGLMLGWITRKARA